MAISGTKMKGLATKFETVDAYAEERNFPGILPNARLLYSNRELDA